MTSRPGMLALVLAPLALVATSCGGGADREARQTAPRSAAASPGGSLNARLEANAGEDVELALGSSDFAVGRNRFTFAVVRSNGELVQVPRARVFVARTADRAPEIQATAGLVPLGPHSHPGETPPHDHADVTDLYVTQLIFRTPGRYAVLVEPEGETIQAAAEIIVRRRSRSPAIGSRAFPSRNPTVDDAPAAEITTARPPDTELLRSSISDAIADRAPFVVAFATPKFCQSRTCGPTVEVVDIVRKRFAGRGIRFIHVEVYKDNDPSNGVNRWMKEWKLPSEPWVFVVDGNGRIRAKYEGSVSVSELEEAVRRHLG